MQNSVRHCLSLSTNFQRVVEGNMTLKKGLQWEMVPAKMEKVECEISDFQEKEELQLQPVSSKLACSEFMPFY